MELTVAHEDRSLPRSGAALGLFLAASFAVAALGGLATAGNVAGWYADAEKPAWTPPDGVFGAILIPYLAWCLFATSLNAGFLWAV